MPSPLLHEQRGGLGADQLAEAPRGQSTHRRYCTTVFPAAIESMLARNDAGSSREITPR